MLNAVLIMAAALVVFIGLWRRSEGLRAESEADYAALLVASKASMDAATEVKAVLDEQEDEIRSLQKVHSTIKRSLKEASEGIDRSAGSPERVAGLWNKTFSGEK